MGVSSGGRVGLLGAESNDVPPLYCVYAGGVIEAQVKHPAHKPPNSLAEH